jgi:carbonic anhydrase/acetyltransferase-like protein (isoleucine patch superfamily)
MAIYELDGVRPELPGGADCWIAPSASVVGRVRLARDTSVWFGACLRGDNDLIDVGEGSNIQDGCVLHTDLGYPLTIGRNVTVGHQAMLHGCTVEDTVLIGMGASVLNGAVIGHHTVIGAHALIPEGKVIPPHSLVVGTPGRVVRILNEAEIASLEEAASIYIAKIPRYNRGLVRID